MAYRRTLVAKRVVVTLKTDTVLTGVLYARRGPLLVIKDAGEMQRNGSGEFKIAKADGELVVHESNVDFIQVTPETA